MISFPIRQTINELLVDASRLNFGSRNSVKEASESSTLRKLAQQNRWEIMICDFQGREQWNSQEQWDSQPVLRTRIHEEQLIPVNDLQEHNRGDYLGLKY